LTRNSNFLLCKIQHSLQLLSISHRYNN
jgi:hypothetical protein